MIRIIWKLPKINKVVSVCWFTRCHDWWLMDLCYNDEDGAWMDESNVLSSPFSFSYWQWNSPLPETRYQNQENFGLAWQLHLHQLSLVSSPFIIGGCLVSQAFAPPQLGASATALFPSLHALERSSPVVFIKSTRDFLLYKL